MAFIDEVKIEVIAGKGGDGVVSFRREKYVPNGGPNGGNGGNGGSVIFVGDEGLNTLFSFRYKKIIKANSGNNGESANKRGKNGIDTFIKVPLGTVVIFEDNNKILGEITKHNEKLIVAHGGRGGRGNASFKTNKNQVPDIREKGLPGERFNLRLELKLVADVGIIGMPNAGKSSFVNAVSNAKPKIADYPFTTLEPSLGVCNYKDNFFVIEDIPGLVVDASKGIGLGFRFLRHIERCLILCHIVDSSDENCYENYLSIRNELKSYDEKLLEKKEIIVLNKMDLISEDRIKKLKKQFKDHNVIFSSIAGFINIDLIVKTLSETLDTIPKNVTKEEEIEITIDNYSKNIKNKNNIYEIVRENDYYVIKGEIIEELFFRTDFNNPSSVKRFSYQLKKIGIDEKLIEFGCKNGDTIRILNYEFEFID